MWLLGEAGWVGLAAGVAAVVALGAMFFGKRWNACGPYRHLAAVCVALFFMHTIVDVPAHRWGTWMLAAFLLGIAAPDGEGIELVATWLPRWVWRVAGVGFFLIGCAWLAAQAGLPLNATLEEQRAQAQADTASANKNGAAAIAAADTAIKTEPMLWRPYFQRASAELTWEGDAASALRDFRLARFLEPTWARVPFAEGLLWEPTNHDRAFAAWREAIHRQDETPEGLWRNIYDELKLWPDGEEYESILSQTRPLFRWEFLVKQVSAKRLPQEWAIEMERDPGMTEYTEAQRRDILKRLASVDGAAALDYLRSHPNIINESWMIEATAAAAAGRPAEAVELARQNLMPVPLPDLSYDGPKDLASVKADFASNNNDLHAGTMLAKLQFQAKDYAGEADTLRQMATWSNPPSFVSWNLSDALARDGKMQEAWDALQPYLQYAQGRAANKTP